MTHSPSIRLFIRRGRDGCDAHIEGVPQDGCHLRIEAKARDDGALVLKLAIRPDARPGRAQRDDMQGTEEPPVNQSIYDQFAALGQVNEYDFSSFLSHCNQSFKEYPRPAFEQHLRAVSKREGPR